MLTIRFTFTANRYHATPWDRQVNEGVVEWPPSPWRILRGLVATWRRTLPDLPSDRVEPILVKLASEYPKFGLPPASVGHTRHYMPYNEGAKKRTTLVIDSFVGIKPDAPLLAVWPGVQLSSEQAGDLQGILRNMPYLGRAESWVTAELVSDTCELNCWALESGEIPRGDLEVVRTLVPHAHVGLDDLEVETSELRAAGRKDPEGAHWFPYVRSRDCLTGFRTVGVWPKTSHMKPTVVRFALSGRVLPMTPDTLRWGEMARRAAMGRYGSMNAGGASYVLSGKDTVGRPGKGHGHAFYIFTDENGDRWLDHLTVWAPAGLDAKEIRAVIAMNELKHPDPRRHGEPLQLAYQAHGREEDFVGVAGLFGRSNRWQSLTPYVLPRHRKRSSDGPEDQVRREVGLRWPGREVKVSVRDPRERIQPMEAGRSDGFRPFDFHRYRRGGGSRGGGAFNCQLEFEEPVYGPIALGFACHYGLGVFVPSCG